MRLHFSAGAAAAACAVLLAGCGGSAADEAVAGPGMTDLAPSYDARPTGEAAQPTPKQRTRQEPGGRRAEDSGEQQTTRANRPTTKAPRDARPQTQPHGRTGPTGQTGQAVPTGPEPEPGPVRVTDPAGDLSRSLEGAPASADIVAVRLERAGDTVVVRTTFAGAVPATQSANQGKGMNVASFYDVDGNGLVDYEVWASLADNGWGTGYRDARQRTAAFGSSTGIEVSVEGKTLVTRFPADRIAGADAFGWSAAAEWGSFESMAAGTSARDHAPEEQAASYPAA
jgi:hypothetical protein